jgi:hypothetical protein
MKPCIAGVDIPLLHALYKVYTESECYVASEEEKENTNL